MIDTFNSYYSKFKGKTRVIITHCKQAVHTGESPIQNPGRMLVSLVTGHYQPHFQTSYSHWTGTENAMISLNVGNYVVTIGSLYSEVKTY